MQKTDSIPDTFPGYSCIRTARCDPATSSSRLRPRFNWNRVRRKFKTRMSKARARTPNPPESARIRNEPPGSSEAPRVAYSVRYASLLADLTLSLVRLLGRCRSLSVRADEFPRLAARCRGAQLARGVSRRRVPRHKHRASRSPASTQKSRSRSPSTTAAQ